MKLRVGVLQIDISTGDRDHNFRKVKDWMASFYVPSELPTAIVLPELWSTGYALDRASELADPEGTETAAFLGEIAVKYGVWFTGGSVLASTRDGFVNRAQVINPQGDLAAWYDKVHLFRLMGEDERLAGGNKTCIFDIEGVTAGCVICYDIRFCEWVRTYTLKGAQALFISAQWPTARVDHWRTLLRARAIENQIYIAACNRCGTSGNTRFPGASMILGPRGEVYFEGDDGEQFAFATIEFDEIREAREQITVFDDRRPELYSLKQDW